MVFELKHLVLSALVGAVFGVLAFVFVVLRVAYIMMYVSNQANVRSVVWMLAFAANIGILFVGYR